MITTGQSITNSVTGETLVFRTTSADTNGERVVVETFVEPNGAVAAAHVHPGQEERFEVLEGRAAFRIDGVEIEAAAGSVVVAPPGRRHLAWNPTDEPVRLRIEMRPALRWWSFTTRFFAGDDPIALLDEFRDNVVLPP